MTGEAGFFGKLPARGDFLRAGLPRSFVQPWDDWCQAAIAGSRAILGAAWLPAWMEAPVWRFHLPPGQCGPAAALGVWMPSVDRAGRHFPLTLAMLGEGLQGQGAWLEAAEAAGLDALAQDDPPEALAARLQAARDRPPGARLPELDSPQALWWTDGAPLVPAGRRVLAALPDAACFAAMLHADTPQGEAVP